MNSSLNFSSIINDEKFLYENYFGENDDKSRIFEDLEKDLSEKIEVSKNNITLILNKFNYIRNYLNF